jgi:hypothetical protein
MNNLMGQLIRLEYRVLDNNEVTPNDHNELCDIARNIVNCGIDPNEPLLGMSPDSEFKKLYDSCMDVLSRELQPILD